MNADIASIPPPARSAPAHISPFLTYAMYGLRVRTDLNLPCPPVDGGVAPADLEVVRGSDEEMDRGLATAEPVDVRNPFFSLARISGGGFALRWTGHFECVIAADGSRVLWRPLRDIPDAVLHTYLLGQVLSFCLVRHGVEPLHATSVVLGGRAIALLGDSGYGKSTLGAALVASGGKLLTDDVLVAYRKNGSYFAEPGLGRIKLLPDSADAVFYARRSVRMNYFTSKMIFRVPAGDTHAAPAPLAAIYELSDPRRPARRIVVRNLQGRRALLPLLRNTFNDLVDAPERLHQQLQFAGGLAASVPIKSLSYPRELDRIGAVVEAIRRAVERMERR